MSRHNDNPVYKIDAGLPPISPPGPEPEPQIINNESQLFADDALVAHRRSVHRRLNRPRKQEAPILVPDREWEGQSILYGCIVEHEGVYRLYYKSKDWRSQEDTRGSRYGRSNICIAQSADPVEFAKEPIAGAVHEGTNIVVEEGIDDFTVHKDVDDPDPERRFKILSSYRNWWAGLTPATSPDGIRWTWGERVAVPYLGDRCSYWYDPIRKKHIAWSRNYQVLGSRVIFHRETDDFGDWSPREDTSDTRGGDYRGDTPWLAIAPDRYDHEETQIYGGYGFWYRSMYFAYVEMFHPHQQRIDTQLACSRDGLNWTRLCDRELFLRNGDHGEFDAYWVVPTFNPPLLKDGRLLIHYNGRPDPHITPGFNHVPPGMEGAFGLATLREDGFVSLDATGAEGVVETPTMRLPEKRSALEINCCPFKVRPGFAPMEVKVEILSADGVPLSAYGLYAVDDERVWYRIEPESPLPDLVRLRFRLTNARLYSFKFPEA